LRFCLRIGGDNCFDLIWLSCWSFRSNFVQTIPLPPQPNQKPISLVSPLTLRVASRTYEQRLCHPYNIFPCRPCAFDGPSDRVAWALISKPTKRCEQIISFSSKFTILPFLYLQTICHLYTIIYYGTFLHRSHVISHTLKLNHITPNVSYAHAYKGFVPILIHQNKRSWQIFPRPNMINIR